MAVASRYGSFPILLETYRECLQDVFDLPALQDVLRGIQQRHIRVTSVETAAASPFARSLLFDYIAEFMYEGDAPLAERRAQALTLDRERLRELLGQEELRELLDPSAVDELELELQSLGERRVRTRDQLHDLLRRVGELSDRGSRRALQQPAESADWLRTLAHRTARRRSPHRGRGPLDCRRRRRRATATRSACSRRAACQTSSWRRASMRSMPCSCAGRVPMRRSPRVIRPAAGACLRRWSTTPCDDSKTRAASCAASFDPGGAEREWCDADVLRSLRRRSLARLRREVEPVPGVALARFLPAWHGVGSEAGSLDRLMDVVAQLEGVFVPWSIYERDVLPARVRGYQPRLLDELCASGELVWLGRGSIGSDDGRVALFRRERLPLLAPTAPEEPPAEPIHDRHSAAPCRARRVVFPRDLFGRGWANRRRGAGGAVGPGLVRRGHQRHADAASPAVAASRAHASARASHAERPARSRRALVAGDHRRTSHRAIARAAPWRCSNATAWSLASRSWAKACRVVSPRSIPSCEPWRKPARFGAATSSRVWAPRSSRCRARSTACAPNARRRGPDACTCWPLPIRPTRTAPRSPGRRRAGSSE